MRFLRKLLFLGLVFMIAIPAASAITIEVDTPDSPVEAGKTVKVPVKISFEKGEEVSGIQLMFPSSNLMMDVEVDEDNFYSKDGVAVVTSESKSYSYASLTGFNEDVDLFYLYVTPKFEQNVSVNVSLEEILAPAGENPPVSVISDTTIKNGTIIVKKSEEVNLTTKKNGTIIVKKSEEVNLTTKPTESEKPNETTKPVDLNNSTKPDETADTPKDTSKPTDEKKDTPGFEILGAVLGLSAAGIILKRRK